MVFQAGLNIVTMTAATILQRPSVINPHETLFSCEVYISWEVIHKSKKLKRCKKSGFLNIKNKIHGEGNISTHM